MSDTLFKQKLAIAKLLPERIAVIGSSTPNPMFVHCSVNGTVRFLKDKILDTEWLQIVQWVEEGLTCKSTYLAELAHVCGFGTLSPLDEKYDEMIFTMVHATVSQRLAALEAAGIINTKE